MVYLNHYQQYNSKPHESKTISRKTQPYCKRRENYLVVNTNTQCIKAEFLFVEDRVGR